MVSKRALKRGLISALFFAGASVNPRFHLSLQRIPFSGLLCHTNEALSFYAKSALPPCKPPTSPSSAILITGTSGYIVRRFVSDS